MDRPDVQDASGGPMPDGMITAALAKVPLALVLTNPHLDDNPIVYANQAFAKITGYTVDATIGRNCRFLQGEETDPQASALIGDALKNERDISIDLINYRANGTKFLNRLMITPIYDGDNNLQCFLGVQRDMSEGEDLAVSRETELAGEKLDAALGEIQHRVKNHLAMIIGMIRMQSRAETSADAFNALARRIESLQLLYQEMTEAGVGSTRSDKIPLGAYVSRIASTIGYLDGRNSVRVNVDCDAIDVSVEKAARIGLLFSELLTNALKHAFTDREEGLVEARLKLLSSGVIRLTVTDDGVGMPAGSTWPHRARETAASGQSVGEAVAMTEEPNTARQIAETIAAGARPAPDSADEAPARDGEAAAGTRVRQAGGLGGRIVVSLVQGLDALIDVNSDTVGTTVTIDIPQDD